MKNKILLFLSLVFVFQLFVQCNECDCPCDCDDIPSEDDVHYWTPVQSPVNNDLFDVFFINEKVGWAVGNESAIIKTSDGGKSWTKQSYPDYTNFSAVFFINENEGWITGTYGTIVHTADGGTSWTLLTNGNKENGHTERFNDLYFTTNKVGWVVGDNATGDGGVILKTTDGGSTWDDIVTDLPTHLYCLKVASPDRILVGGGFSSPALLYDTSDGGENWYITELGTDDFNIQGIDVSGNNIYLVCSWQDFGYVSDDNGETWIKSSNFGNAGEIFVDNNIVWLFGGEAKFSVNSGETFITTTEANSQFINEGNGIYGSFAMGEKAWVVADKGKTFYY